MPKFCQKHLKPIWLTLTVAFFAVVLRPWQINFSVMYVHILLFYNICLSTHFHIKIFVCVNEVENTCTLFYKHSVFFFWGVEGWSPSVYFSNLSLTLFLQSQLLIPIVWHLNFLCIFTLRHLSKRCKTFAKHSEKFIYF